MTLAEDRGWLATALATVGAAAALAVAFTAQYGFALAPCTVCYWQRVPYAVVVVLGLLALMPAVGERERRIVLFHLAALLLIDAGLAFYHVGVEAHWWAGPAYCSGAGAVRMSMDDLSAALKKAAGPSCDQPAFRFAGLSIAGYNLIAAAILSAFAFAAAGKRSWWRGV